MEGICVLVSEMRLVFRVRVLVGSIDRYLTSHPTLVFQYCPYTGSHPCKPDFPFSVSFKVQNPFILLAMLEKDDFPFERVLLFFLPLWIES